MMFKGTHRGPVLARSMSERGASGIVVSLVTLFVLLPLAGFATSAYVRQGVIAELTMAADAGALAGAASIPLGDLQGVLAIPSAPEPLVIACDQALKTAEANGLFGDAFGPGTGSNPPPTCTAEYLPDTAFATEFGGCVNTVSGGLGGPITDSVANLLPGLVRPGVKVTLSRAARGPLESLIDPNASAETDHTVESRARRRFKNALVIPIVNLVPGAEINLNPVAGVVADTAIATLETALGPLLPAGCENIFDAVRDDFADVANPPGAGAPTTTDILEEADNQDAPALVFGFVGLVPFFDFATVCVEKSGSNYVALVGCGANAPGAFRASLVNI